MTNLNLNSVNFNGKTYRFIQKELQDAFLDLGIVTFRYYPQEKLLIASEHFVNILKSERIYSNMPQSLADKLIAEEDRAVLYDMASRIDNGEKKVSEVLRTRNGHISRVTLSAIETAPNGKILTMAGLVEDVAETTRTSALLEALSTDYSCVYYVDYKKNIVIPERLDPRVLTRYGEILKSKPSYETIINAYIKNSVIEVEKEEMTRLCSTESLKKYFAENSVFVHDFRSVYENKIVYCRMKIVNMSKSEDLTDFVIGFSDMSRDKVNELEKMAFVDQLTGGNNYNSFKRKVRDLNCEGFLISMDIHQFKIVNSICGVNFGDLVLKKIWEALVANCKPGDVAGHVNADHFVVFTPSSVKEEIEERIELFSESLYKLSVRMKCPRLFPYFGVTRYNPAKRIEEAYSETTVAKHAIKADTKTNYLFYSRKQDTKNMLNKSMEDAFPSALARGDFEIWYQPKFNPVTKQVVGAEALVRWRLPSEKRLVPPEDFIPLFESNGLIRTLDEYVFDSVCRFIRRRMKSGKKVVPISVNLSRASLYIEGVADQYKNIADDIGIPVEYVPIEITESATSNINRDNMNAIMQSFRDKGFTLCVDDFGTGYSTLSLLSRRQFENLKLDKSLIDDITNDDGYKLIKHTIALSKDLGMNVTAEGVEKDQQLNILIDLGCDSIQGFLFSAPVQEETFVSKLDN